MAKKVVQLTENDLINLVKRVITEQKKFELLINQGQTMEGELNGNIMTLTTENGQVQIFLVKTALPTGKFMFEYGKDGNYYGYDKNGKKYGISLLEKRK
jgi:hypothetical protein